MGIISRRDSMADQKKKAGVRCCGYHLCVIQDESIMSTPKHRRGSRAGSHRTYPVCNLLSIPKRLRPRGSDTFHLEPVNPGRSHVTMFPISNMTGKHRTPWVPWKAACLTLKSPHVLRVEKKSSSPMGSRTGATL